MLYLWIQQPETSMNPKNNVNSITIFDNSGLVVLELVVEVDIKYKKVSISNRAVPYLPKSSARKKMI